MEVLTVMKEIKKIAKENLNREESKKTRKVGKDINCFRQGDLYLFRVANNHAVGFEVKRRQIADGTSIGARHVLKGNFKVYEGVQCPDGVNELHAKAGLGYCIDVSRGDVLVHPEHDNFYFDCEGRFQVLHQVDIRTLRKVAD